MTILLQSSNQLFYPYKLLIMNILYKEKEINIVTLRTRLSISDGGLQSHFRYLKKDNLVHTEENFEAQLLLQYIL